MEQPIPSPIEEQSKRAPWGTIIGIILILAIVVASAYFAVSKRIAVTSVTSAVSVR